MIYGLTQFSVSSFVDKFSTISFYQVFHAVIGYCEDGTYKCFELIENGVQIGIECICIPKLTRCLNELITAGFA